MPAEDSRQRRGGDQNRRDADLEDLEDLLGSRESVTAVAAPDEIVREALVPHRRPLREIERRLLGLAAGG